MPEEQKKKNGLPYACRASRNANPRRRRWREGGKVNGLPFCFSWTGCPAIDACLSEQLDGKRVALCRACSLAKPRREKKLREWRRPKRSDPRGDDG